MNWVAPAYLSAPVLLIPVFIAVLLGSWWHRRKLAQIFGADLLDRVLPRSVRVRRRIRDIGAAIALVLGCIALAEPAFDKEIVQVKAEGVDLVLAVDLSRSMDARDVDPSRMERVRREITDLMDLLTGDRVGVVFFAGGAVPRLPLTQDYRSVEWVLEEADTSLFKAQGSALGPAIEVATELLGRDEGKAGKAIVVFSDGETHEPEEAVVAAEAAREQGVIIYSVGVGESPSPIPLAPGGFLREGGKQVMTNPDFSTLREVARITGGRFTNSVPSAKDMEDLYTSAIRGALRSVERDSQQTEKWKTMYQVPLGIGLGLWLAGAWLGDGRRRFGAAGVVLLALAVATPQVASAQSLLEADQAYRSEQYGRAERIFEELVLDNPGDPELLDRLGATRYRMGDYVGSAVAYEQASKLRGGDAAAEYNAGNARYRAGQLEEALQRYDEALKADSGHQRAAANKQVVNDELVLRRQQEPPPPPNPEQSGDNEEQSEGGEGSENPEEGQSGDQQQQQDGDGSADANGEPEEGEPQDGESSEDGQPGEGEPQEGDSADNSNNQDSQDSDSQQNGSNNDASGDDPSDEQRDGESPGESPSDLDGSDDSDGGSPSGEPTGVGETSGNITPAQASRMLDGVEEGSPRMEVKGRSSNKPW